MKKLISTIAIAYCSILIVSCDNSQNSASTETQKDSITQVKTDSPKSNSVKTTTANQSKTDNNKQASSKQPTVGTVKSMQNGDLLCYVILVDENGNEHNLGADFDICAQEKAFLNKKVRVYYETASVSDCQSAEPCGKTRKESIVTKMEILGKKS
ncbi:MAG: hypothetical protein IGS49_20240 [Chlorogloeopsis fritschii C42_A2020_084]|uniref:hypothetical protein n=1 Tax=Chlorogloeopsis fritschii TaxID=1124 RepID=UPI001A0084E1|nr:hypothetical protein [Chlorogloeopsis fritschii]MBF2007717.1 hypothetical protein [Chlorogloeopsis fritschii C42_A2020_084]